VNAKELGARVLCALGAPAFARRARRRDLLVLMYHGVSDFRLSPACWHQLDARSFRRQMEWLARRYAVLPLSEALPRLASDTLPPRACAITFDDGYRNVATNAFPVLARLGLPSTVFLATGTVGTDRILWPDALYLAFAATRAPALDLSAFGHGVRRLATDAERAVAYDLAVHALKALPAAEKDARLEETLRALGADPAPRPGPFRALTWDDVRGLAASGLVEFGGHSVTHDLLSRLPDAEVVRQVAESHATVAARTGRPPVAFAYPNGRAIDFDDRAQAAVRGAGLRWALSTVEGHATPASDPLALPRMGIGADESSAVFRLHASGALLALRSWRPGNPG
jgi:peptidoglycan/xylan/chitin deacetylase (PgdA/CDA1 family)